MIFRRLFSTAAIGGIEVRNRLVMPPMHTNLGDPEAGIDFYVARARGGFGMVGVGIIDSFQFGHASPRFKCPERLAAFDELPMAMSGLKVDRRRLAALVASGPQESFGGTA